VRSATLSISACSRTAAVTGAAGRREAVLDQRGHQLPFGQRIDLALGLGRPFADDLQDPAGQLAALSVRTSSPGIRLRTIGTSSSLLGRGLGMPTTDRNGVSCGRQAGVTAGRESGVSILRRPKLID